MLARLAVGSTCAFLISACATSRSVKVPEQAAPAAVERREDANDSAKAVVEAAREAVGRVRGPGDCVAFLRGTFRTAGIELPESAARGDNAVTALFRAAREQGRIFDQDPPMPGDIAFFRETYDRNRDGARNDGLTHVALVESIDAEGTLSLLHRGSKGAARITMDRSRPREERDPDTGKLLNDSLRRGVHHPTPHLTGELFVTYARFIGPPRLYARAVRSHAAP